MKTYSRLADPTRAQLQFWALLALCVLGYWLQDVSEGLARLLAFVLLLLLGIFFLKRGQALAVASGRLHRAVFGARAGRASQSAAAALFRVLGVGILVLLPVGIIFALIDQLS